MSDASENQDGINSPEKVALDLMMLIGKIEGKHLTIGTPSADREWVLNTYSECLETVKHPHKRAMKQSK